MSLLYTGPSRVGKPSTRVLGFWFLTKVISMVIGTYIPHVFAVTYCRSRKKRMPTIRCIFITQIQECAEAHRTVIISPYGSPPPHCWRSVVNGVETLPNIVNLIWRFMGLGHYVKLGLQLYLELPSLGLKCPANL